MTTATKRKTDALVQSIGEEIDILKEMVAVARGEQRSWKRGDDGAGAAAGFEYAELLNRLVLKAIKDRGFRDVVR